MLRSMYSGITGLRNFQTKLDVIGNNISNVNTYGFKKGRTVFKDLVSQTVAGASGPTGTQGGTNPRQVGLGSQLAAIDTLHGQGSSQFTGNTTDLSITGDGFFQVIEGGEVLYTRAGNFYMDRNGDLVDGDGRYLQGMQGKPLGNADYEDAGDGAMGLPILDTNITYGKIQIPESASSMSIGQDGTVYFVDTTAAGKTAIETAAGVFRPHQEAFKAAEIIYQGVIDNPTSTEEQIRDAQTAFDAAKETYEGHKNTYDRVVSINEAVLQVAGRLQLATFSNPGGLEKVGGNLFRASANSGDVNEGFATDQGFGTMESGFLEMSNVDLAEEFTEMIVAQRGFQANTRIITTSDEILQELVNLKR